MAQNNPDLYQPWPRDWLKAPEPEPELKDMTPAQIHKKHGAEVAAYVVELRASTEMWRRLYNGRLSQNGSAVITESEK